MATWSLSILTSHYIPVATSVGSVRNIKYYITNIGHNKAYLHVPELGFEVGEVSGNQQVETRLWPFFPWESSHSNSQGNW